MKLFILFTFSLSIVPLTSCWPSDVTVVTEIKIESSLLLAPPTLTAKEKHAIASYLESVHWRPFPLVDSNTHVDYFGFRPFGLMCRGRMPNGKHIFALIDLYDDFTPFVVIGDETPEYKAMAEVLKSFRKRTPLKTIPNYREVLEAAKPPH